MHEQDCLPIAQLYAVPTTMLRFVVTQQDGSVLQGLSSLVVEACDGHHCSQAQLAEAIFQVT